MHVLYAFGLHVSSKSLAMKSLLFQLKLPNMLEKLPFLALVVSYD